MHDLTIALVNYYNKKEILNAIHTVLLDCAHSSYDVAVVVVDNSQNKDGVAEALRQELPAVHYIDAGENIGFGRATTKGFKAEPARYYFALNPDTRIPAETDVVRRIILFMDAHPKIGAMGPKLIYRDGTLQLSCYRFNLSSLLMKPLKQISWEQKYRMVRRPIDYLLMKDFDHKNARPVDWVLGAALIVRREAVEQAGWFDERYFMYMEDCDWCRNLWENGWPVYYVPDIVIEHDYARESAKIPGIFKALYHNKLARIQLLSWIKYMWKWRGRHNI